MAEHYGLYTFSAIPDFRDEFSYNSHIPTSSYKHGQDTYKFNSSWYFNIMRLDS